MNTNPTRPEVDDPRVLALAKARQQMAYRNPFNVVCPPWDGLDKQEQHLSLLDARNYLRAAIDAGLIPAVSSPPAADRGAVLREAADALEAWQPEPVGRWTGLERHRYEDGIDAAADRLRRMADEAQQQKPTTTDRTTLEHVRRIARRLAAHAVGFQDVLDDSDRGPWGRTVGADIAELIDALADQPAVEAQQQPDTETQQADEVALLRLAVDAVEEGRRELRAENARLRAQLWTLAAALDGLHTLIATSSRDWGAYRVDAWLWALLCGWDCEETHEHDELCDDGAAMAEMQEQHGWSDEAVAKARRYRAAVRALTEPAAVSQPGKET